MGRQSDEFWKKPLEQSRIKAQIVSKYFYAWGKAMVKYSTRDPRFAYIDFCAGRGRYDNGEESTSLLVLRQVLRHSDFRARTQLIFNDQDPDDIRILEDVAMSIDGTQDLPNKPVFGNKELSDDLADIFSSPVIPTLTFLDPWGYKALISRDFISSTIRHWGCDCIFFFNYRRINRSLSNDAHYRGLYSVLGRDRVDGMRRELSNGLSPLERERLCVREFKSALSECGVSHPLMFRIQHRNVSQTSHYLVFLSKNSLAHHLMKSVMSGFSERTFDGIPQYAFANREPVPQSASQLGFMHMIPMDPPSPNDSDQTPMDDVTFEVDAAGFTIDQLKTSLMETFAGQRLKMNDVYHQHQMGTPYYLPNYRTALLQLEEEGLLVVDVPREKRMRNGAATLGTDRIIDFRG